MRALAPVMMLRAWMLIYYEEDKKIDADKFWKEVGKGDYASHKEVIKADGLVKKTAAERIAVGDLNVKLDGMNRGDEAGVLTRAFDRMSQSLQKLATASNQIAGGDLRGKRGAVADETGAGGGGDRQVPRGGATRTRERAGALPARARAPPRRTSPRSALGVCDGDAVGAVPETVNFTGSP